MSLPAVALVGGTGFVGRHLAERLSAAGAAVTVIARQAAGLPAGVRFEAQDARSAEAVAPLLPSGGVVVNLAYDRHAPPASNLETAAAVIAACRRAGSRRLIHVSTVGVFGPVPSRWVDETTPCRPWNEYQRVKWEIEKLLRERAGDGLELVLARPSQVFGRGGASLRKIAVDLLEDPPAKRWLRRSLYGARPLHLVQVETVAAALEHLLALRDLPDDPLFVVAEDEEPGNDYLSVHRVMREALGLPPPRLPRLPLPAAVLVAILRGRGRLAVHPRTRYSSRRLRATGFVAPVPFPRALADYAGELAAELRGGIRAP